MFGSEVISDWKKGSPIVWRGGLTKDGNEIIYVKGEIKNIDIGKSVSFTIFDPNTGIKDIPENYVTLR